MCFYIVKNLTILQLGKNYRHSTNTTPNIQYFYSLILKE